MSFKLTEKNKEEKIGICSGSVIPEADPRIRIKIKRFHRSETLAFMLNFALQIKLCLLFLQLDQIILNVSHLYPFNGQF